MFGPRAKENEEIRGLLNAGHRKGAVAGRCVVRGKEVFTEELPAYCAVAMAGLGYLPDTILTRSVIVNMRRRAPTETVEPYRRRVHGAEGMTLRDRLTLWATSARDSISSTYPSMPAGVVDRDADVWEALLAVADSAGGEWPARARVAAVTFVTAARDSTPSLGVRLLADLRQVFSDSSQMSTTDIIKGLTSIEEAPWADIRGQAIDSRRLANYLRPFAIHSKLIRFKEQVARGYAREDLVDAWARYLGPTVGPSASVTRVTTATANGTDGPDVTDVTDVTRPAGPSGGWNS